METETTYDTTEGNVRHWTLFSGGHDSLVAAHYLMENGYTESVLHLDTTTGVPENEQFVKDICNQYGWPLRIEQSPITLLEYAVDQASQEPFGFPGPRQHTMVYAYLKQEPMRTVATETDGKPHYWTGVRREESDNRMANIEYAVEEADQWYWHSPLRNWKDERMDEYLDEHDIPRNPVVEVIHRSGECFCGCFSSRDEDLIDLQANFPDHFEYIMEIEEEVMRELGEDDDRAYWAHGKLSDSDLTHLKSLREPEDMMLCRDCRRMNQNSGAETDW